MELRATCPHCGGVIDIPQAAVHSDGTARGYCCSCRTEVFEASPLDD
jgi:ribosomal protein S27AE